MYQAKEITEKVYNNIMNSIQKLILYLMNSENIKTSDFHRLLLNLSDKINLKRSYKCVALSTFNIYYTWKIIKKSYNNNKL